jgi:hypothetical protein
MRTGTTARAASALPRPVTLVHHRGHARGVHAHGAGTPHGVPVGLWIAGVVAAALTLVVLIRVLAGRAER